MADIIPVGIEFFAHGALKAQRDIGGVKEAAKGAARAIDLAEDSLRDANEEMQRTSAFAAQAGRGFRGAGASARAAFAGVAAGATRAVGGIRSVTGALSTMGGRGRAATQNVAFQLQDIFTQVALGVPITRSLAIQLPQLLGGFGALGAFAGLAGGGLLAIAGGMFSATKAAKSAEDAIDDLESQVTSLFSVLDLQTTPIDDIVEQFGFLDLTTEALIASLERLERREVGKAFAAALDVGNIEGFGGLFGFDTVVDDLFDAIDDLKKAEKALATGVFDPSVTASGVVGLEPVLERAAFAIRALEATSQDDFEGIRDNAAEAVAAIEALNDPVFDPFLRKLISLGEQAGVIFARLGEQAREAASPFGDELTTGLVPFKPNRGRGGDPAEFGGTLGDFSDPRNVLIINPGDGPTLKKPGGAKADPFANQFKSLLGQLDPAAAAIAAYTTNVDLLDEALRRGVIPDTEAYNDLLLEAQKRLVGVDGALEAVNDAELRAALAIAERANQLEQLGDLLETGVADGLTAVITGAKNAGEALRNLAASVLEQVFRQRIASPIADLIGSFFGMGAAFSSGKVIPMARGAIVNGPTLFPMANGAGLVGEAGPEAVMPLMRGPGGKLGVQATGGGGARIEQHFHFAANGDESVKKIIFRAAPQIAEMTRAAMQDDRQRGGVSRKVFG